MNEVEQERQEKLKETRDNLEVSDEIFEKRFGKDSFGAHEAVDRSYMVQSMWDEWVLEHPFVLKNKRLFDMAYEISEKMARFYCDTAMISEGESTE